MINKKTAFFIALLLPLIFVLPSFAGSSVQQTDSVSSDASDPVLDRAVGSVFYWDSSLDSYAVDVTSDVTVSLSDCPQFFVIKFIATQTLVNFYITGFDSFYDIVLSPTAVVYYAKSYNSSSSAPVEVPRNSSASVPCSPFDTDTLRVYTTATRNCFVSISPSPQDDVPTGVLSSFYILLRNSGVGVEWAGIAVAVTFIILVLSLVIFLFKVCFGRKR